MVPKPYAHRCTDIPVPLHTLPTIAFRPMSIEPLDLVSLSFSLFIPLFSRNFSVSNLFVSSFSSPHCPMISSGWSTFQPSHENILRTFTSPCPWYVCASASISPNPRWVSFTPYSSISGGYRCSLRKTPSFFLLLTPYPYALVGFWVFHHFDDVTRVYSSSKNPPPPISLFLGSCLSRLFLFMSISYPYDSWIPAISRSRSLTCSATSSLLHPSAVNPHTFHYPRSNFFSHHYPRSFCLLLSLSLLLPFCLGWFVLPSSGWSLSVVWGRCSEGDKVWKHFLWCR